MTASTVELNDQNVLEASEVTTDYKALYETQASELEALKNLVAATRVTQQSAGTPDKDRKPAVSADRARALVGEFEWSRMTESQRISSLGVDPATVDRGLLHRAFGRGADSKLANDMYKKTSPYRYRVLREVAVVLNIFGG